MHLKPIFIIVTAIILCAAFQQNVIAQDTQPFGQGAKHSIYNK